MSKAEIAYQTLRNALLDNALRPGSALTVSSLKETYQLGWTPLREALARLEGENLVQFTKNRGYRVAPVSDEDLADLAEARRVVEVSLFIASIQNGDTDWESNVIAAHHRLSVQTIPKSRHMLQDLQAWEAAHQDFHNALLAAGSSYWLERTVQQISEQLRRYHRYLLQDETFYETATREQIDVFEARLAAAQSLTNHTRLMDAALARDIDGARDLMEDHIGLTVATYQAHPINKGMPT